MHLFSKPFRREGILLAIDAIVLSIGCFSAAAALGLSVLVVCRIVYGG